MCIDCMRIGVKLDIVNRVISISFMYYNGNNILKLKFIEVALLIYDKRL